MWLAISRLTRPLSTSLPMPTPGLAVSLAMMVRSRLPWRTISSITRSGVPTAMKPPIIRLAPSGIIATASSTENSFHGEPSVWDMLRHSGACKSWSDARQPY